MALQSNALTTVARVKAMPGLSGKADSEVQDKINLASDLIEEYLQCKLGYQTATYLLQGSGTRELILPVAPVVELTEVLIQGEAVDLDDITFPNDWQERGKLYYVPGWPIEADSSNEAGDPDLATIAFPISVTLRHGYWLPNTGGSKPGDVEALPERIKRACDIACHLAFNSPLAGAARVKSERTAGGYSVQFSDAVESTTRWDTFLPESAQLLLGKYCRRDVLL